MSAIAASVGVLEGGKSVYTKGAYDIAYVPGVPGINDAKLQQMYSTGTAQAIAV